MSPGPSVVPTSIVVRTATPLEIVLGVGNVLDREAECSHLHGGQPLVLEETFGELFVVLFEFKHVLTAQLLLDLVGVPQLDFVGEAV
eukprot:CAMPEP_0116938614 /NCGR_PEP_ID=MMETSP0467-20121206/32237_1 /TAXON_ID=283647 /ORGANISM="Mesodinium pulex, Strain SPMC105" /LENGTH=86 /DNA_ID=CAMNT_0004620719 /DNA_START=489 /DNA_END=749 /DNA_ORIENTATION=+